MPSRFLLPARAAQANPVAADAAAELVHPTSRCQGSAARVIIALGIVLVGLYAITAYRQQMRARGEPDVFALTELSYRVFAAQASSGRGYAAIVGDSIAAAAPYQSVCGRPVVVAAVNGARVEHGLNDILPLLQHDRPSRVVIAIGVNDAKRLIAAPRPQRLAAFEADYRRLIDKARALTPDIAVVLIAPVTKDDWFGDEVFEARMIAAFNQIIIRLAGDAGVPVYSLAALAGADGFARTGTTIDGVHPTAEGYGIWSTVVEQAWNRAKSCN